MLSFLIARLSAVLRVLGPRETFSTANPEILKRLQVLPTIVYSPVGLRTQSTVLLA